MIITDTFYNANFHWRRFCSRCFETTVKPGGVWVDVVSNCTMGLGTRCACSWVRIRPPKTSHNAFPHKPTQSQPPSLCLKARLSVKLLKRVFFNSHANKSHFHKKGFALGLFFKVRAFGTRKRLITVKYVTGPCYRNNAPRKRIISSRFHHIPAL